MSSPKPLIEPGWYNDPEGVYSHQAYWDGEKWTGEIRLGRKAERDPVVGEQTLR